MPDAANGNSQTIQIAIAVTDSKPVAIVHVEGAVIRPVRVLNL
jgi:hypothetical protein